MIQRETRQAAPDLSCAKRDLPSYTSRRDAPAIRRDKWKHGPVSRGVFPVGWKTKERGRKPDPNEAARPINLSPASAGCFLDRSTGAKTVPPQARSLEPKVARRRRSGRRSLTLGRGFRSRRGGAGAKRAFGIPPAPGRSAVPLQSLHPIVEQVLPAVVNVSVATKDAEESELAAPDENDKALPTSPFEEFLRRYFGGQSPQAPSHRAEPRGLEQVALGSGFIIDPMGYVVTNNHLVEEAGTITVVLQDNSRHPARLVGRDALTDVALLKIDSDGKLPYVRWGDSDAAQVGDWVMAVGNPFGLGGTVTVGIISARGRNIDSGPYDDYLQIDAPMNRGNSGGPTFNLVGEVIGINAAILSPSGGSIGIGFAIPSSVAKPVNDQLKAHGTVERGGLGVQIQRLTPEIAKSLGRDEAQGALVAALTADSPAAKAGVRQGDIVLAFAGKKIAEPRDLSLAVATAPIGKEASLTVWRDGQGARAPFHDRPHAEERRNCARRRAV